VTVKLARMWQEILMAKYGAVNVLMEISKNLLEYTVRWTSLGGGYFLNKSVTSSQRHYSALFVNHSVFLHCMNENKGMPKFGNQLQRLQVKVCT
jgi:hypothetical protein